MEGHSQNPPQTQAVTLPADRAFVVQFQGAAAGQAAVIAGRVEQLTSGQRMRFASWEELQRFIEHTCWRSWRRRLRGLRRRTRRKSKEEKEEQACAPEVRSRSAQK